MTFDTFDSYNTDEAYKDNGTTAKGLVAAYKKDNPNGTAEDFYSKLNKTWAQDKDGYVKKAVDEAFTVETPKEEEKPKVEEMTQTTESLKPDISSKTSQSINIKDSDKKYQDEVNNISKYAEKEETKNLEENSEESYDRLVQRIKKSNEAHKNINDHLIDQLPTFLFKRYSNGEFGDPKSSDAKLRLAYFVMNGLQTQMQRISNGAAIAAGRAPLYQGVQSAYEQYQNTNLAKGMEDRWKKYESETNEAIKLAQTHFDNEEDIDNTIKKISSEKRLQTAFNQMDANQKLYLMEVTKKIGDTLGDMDLNEVADLMTGAAFSGTVSKDQAVAVCVAQLVKKTPKLIEQLPEGNIKNMVLSMVGGNASDVIAGFGGSGKIDSNGNETNLTGNIQNYKTIGGEDVSFDFSDPKAGEKIQRVYDDLIKRYKDGKIDAATFKKYYDPMYAESKKHPGSFKTFFSSGSDEAIRKANVAVRVEVSDQIDALNEQAKNGEIKPSDYNEKFKALKNKAQKYGASEKDLKSIDKGKVSDEKILRATEKKNKKK